MNNQQFIVITLMESDNKCYVQSLPREPIGISRLTEVGSGFNEANNEANADIKMTLCFLTRSQATAA